MADFQRYKSSETHKFHRTLAANTTESIYKFQDPTYLGFKPLFDFNMPYGLLASDNNINSALAYLGRIGDNTRKTYLQKFIDMLRDISIKAGWYFQMIEGLDEAAKRDFNMPLLKDKKITFGCLESLDLRITGMIDLYKKACFDWKHRREVIPVNLRRFNMSLYVYDYRLFNNFENLNTSEASIKREEMSKLFGTASNNFDMDDTLGIGRTTNRQVYNFEMCEFDFNDSIEHLTKVTNVKDGEIVAQKIAFTYYNVLEENVYNLYLSGKVSDDVIKAIEKNEDAIFLGEPFVDNTYGTPNNTQFVSEENNIEILTPIENNPVEDNRYIFQQTSKLGLFDSVYDTQDIVLALANIASSNLGSLFLQNTFDGETLNAIQRVIDTVNSNNNNTTQNTNQTAFEEPTINNIETVNTNILDFMLNRNPNPLQNVNDTIDLNVYNRVSNLNETIDTNSSNNTGNVNDVIDNTTSNNTSVVNDTINTNNSNSTGNVNDVIESNVQHPNIGLSGDLTPASNQNVGLDLELEIPPILDVDLNLDLEIVDNSTGEVIDSAFTKPNKIIEKIDNIDFNTNTQKVDIPNLDLKAPSQIKVDLDLELTKTEIKTELSNLDFNTNNKSTNVNDVLEPTNTQPNSNLDFEFLKVDNEPKFVSDSIQFNLNNLSTQISDSIDKKLTNNLDTNFELDFTANVLKTDITSENFLGNTNNRISNDLSSGFDNTLNKTESINFNVFESLNNKTEVLKNLSIFENTKNEIVYVSDKIENTNNNKTDTINSVLFNKPFRRSEQAGSIDTNTNNSTDFVNENVLPNETILNVTLPLSTDIDEYRPNLINPEDVTN